MCPPLSKLPVAFLQHSNRSIERPSCVHIQASQTRQRKAKPRPTLVPHNDVIRSVTSTCMWRIVKPCEWTVVCRAMEPSGVWRNLLSGKQAVPTVPCPSCGAQVPEFRIHSHLDACLTTLPVAEEGEPAAHGGEVVHEVSDGGEQSRHRRGRGVGARGGGRGRGRGRKRREARESKERDGEPGRERSRLDNVEQDRDPPADDEYASFYQRWEYTVAGLDELRKSTPRLSESQKQALSSSGVLTLKQPEASALVTHLDHLLGAFQTPPTTSTEPEVDAPSDQGTALEAWWEQWATAEWPEGPLPSGFHSGLPPRLESELRAVRDVHRDAEGVHTGAQGTAAIHHTTAMKSVLGFSESGGVGGGKSGVVPRPSEVLDKPGNREAVEVGMQPGSKVSRGEQSTVSSRGADEVRSNLEPNVERSTVAESSAGRPGPPSSSRAAPVSNPVETNGASPGMQACPICSCPFPAESSNREINEHIDQCLAEMAGQFD